MTQSQKNVLTKSIFIICLLYAHVDTKLAALEVSVFDHLENAKIDGCDCTSSIAALSYYHDDGLYLNAVPKKIIHSETKEPIQTIENYRDALLNSSDICIDRVELVQSFSIYFYAVDTSIPVHTIRAWHCESRVARQYVLLPSGMLVAPVKSSYEFLASDCIMRARVNLD
jgi:hypothetical protein